VLVEKLNHLSIGMHGFKEGITILKGPVGMVQGWLFCCQVGAVQVDVLLHKLNLPVF
jgi:hypothetical protein